MPIMRAIYTILKATPALAILLLLSQCKSDPSKGTIPTDALFTLLDPAKTGVDFQNVITEGLNLGDLAEGKWRELSAEERDRVILPA